MDAKTHSSPAIGKTPAAGQPLPRVLIFGAALTCGTLAALVVHIFLIKAGFSLGGVWNDLFATPLAMTRAALAWWIIAASACAIAFATVLVLGRDADGWPRGVPWGTAVVLVVLLANAGHAANIPAAKGAGMTLAVNLMAMGLAAIMAGIGARAALHARPAASKL